LLIFRRVAPHEVGTARREDAMQRRLSVGALVLVVCLVGVAVTPGNGRTASPPLEPEVVFRSDVLERIPGAPNVHQVHFGTCDTAGSYQLIVENGVEGSRRVSSGRVLLNGVPVVTESNLNEQVARVVRAVTLAVDNTLEIRLAGGPGGRFRITVEGYRHCLNVRVTAPAPGSVLTDPATVVEGEIETTGTPGVQIRLLLPIRGQMVETIVPAQVNGHRFAAWVALAPGTVQIAALATDDTGRTAEDAISVRFEPDPPDNDRAGMPEVSPTVGFAPLTVAFGGELATDPEIDLLEWDVDGDGRAEFRLPDFLTPSRQVTYTYAIEGLYVARILAHHAPTGRTLSARAPINVIPRPNLGAIWNGFRAALARGDVEGALRSIALDERDRYRRALTGLGTDLGALAAELQGLTPAVVQPGYATGTTIRVRDGVTEGVVVHFLRDADGVWRIAGL
jgi:hypothetical protein